MSDYKVINKYLRILELLPRPPQSITVNELIGKLKQDNLNPGTPRTIERNLCGLAQIFAITADDSKKPFKWSWAEAAEGFQLPKLTPSAGLITLMAWEHLRIMMPDSQLAEIRSFQNHAKAALSPESQIGQQQTQAVEQWLTEKTAIVNAYPLKPAHVDSKIIEAVHDALYRDYWLKIDYRNVEAIETKERVVAPLALVVRGHQIAYLVVRFRGYPDPRIINLQRIAQAEVLDEPFTRDGFSLKDYLEARHFEFGDWGMVELKLRLSAYMVNILRETVLSEDQCIEPDPDYPGCYLLTAQVRDTRMLRQWILAQGSDIVVLEPEQTRDAIAEEVAILSEQYEV
jgi:predicted DNA-binding transcriptional regulator YafY